MPLILAIEPDRRQAAQLSVVVRKRVHAELILVETTEQALDAIGGRMPDLVLVPALLSPQDDAALAAALRVIAAAARVQMLTIPVLGTPRPAAAPGGVLAALRRGKPRAAEPDGCDPAVFAEQIASYLERAAQERPNAGAETAPAEMKAADRQPRIDEASSAALPAVEQASGSADDPVNQQWLEPAPEQEWVDPLQAQEWLQPVPQQEWVEPAPVDYFEEPIAAATDEGVSLAVEEAVRALFADLPPMAFEPSPDVAAPAETIHGPVMVASVHTEAAAGAQEKDEWVAVDELMAALQLMPLAAIEVTEEDDWLAPASKGPHRVAERPDGPTDGPEGDVIDLTKDLNDDDGQALAASSPVPSAAKSEREWVALIESLRHDVERLRIERSEKPGRKAAPAPVPVKAARPDRPAKPAQDEWGFFDPQQCGFAALLAKLDEVTDLNEEEINH